MGYVDHNPPSYSSSSVKSAILTTADAGVNYSTDSLLIDDGQASDLKNMWLKNGILTSKPALSDKIHAFAEGKNINSLTSFEDATIIHIGTELYKFDGNEAILLLEGLPDARSIPVEFAGKLFLYSKQTIFTVTRDFEAKEEFPYAPMWCENMYIATGTGTKIESFKPNMLAPFVSCSYKVSIENIERNGIAYPVDMDTTRKHFLYLNDELLSEDQFYIENTRIYFNDVNTSNGDVIKLSYYSTNEEFDLSQRIWGCTVGSSFGGGTLDGTRVILGGNSEYPGRYFTSELGDGLRFYEDSGGVIGAGTEDITAFSKQYVYLMIFTKNTVSRMSYTYDADLGGYFTVKTISTSIGCDIPDSVEVVDNRTVFANTDGIYIIDVTDNFDELNIVPISKNITDNYGKNGYFSVPKEELLQGKCCLYDRKYMFLAGERIFIWDYGQVAYASSSDFVKSAKRLVWFEFDSDRAKWLTVTGRKLYCIKEIDGCYEIYAYDENKKSTQNNIFFLSKNMDLSYPHMKKTVVGFNLECKTDVRTPITVEFFADGKKYKSCYAEIEPNADGYAVFSVKLPKYALSHFAFAIKPGLSSVGIVNTRIDYVVLKRNVIK